MTSDSIEQLTKEIRSFNEARGWHKLGNAHLKPLAISISLEAAELLEYFQWVADAKAQAHADENLQGIAEELADVVIYALQFADVAGIDLGKAIQRKIEKNGEKYPVGTEKK